MKITSVKIYPVGKKESFIGYADVVFDDCFVVRGLKVYRTKAGKICSVAPKRNQTKRDKELERHVESFHPINNEMREHLDSSIAQAVEALKTQDQTAE